MCTGTVIYENRTGPRDHFGLVEQCNGHGTALNHDSTGFTAPVHG